MMRYFILDSLCQRVLVGSGEEGRAAYEAWVRDHANDHLRLRRRHTVGQFVYSLEFDGVTDSELQVHESLPLWLVVRRRIGSASRTVLLRSSDLDDARVEFHRAVDRAERDHREHQRASEYWRTAASEARDRIARRASTAMPAQFSLRAEPAAEITTDLIGTPIEPENGRAAR